MESITKYYDGEIPESGHTDDHCDKCEELIGKRKLKALPFLYCDKNDYLHPDLSPLVGYPVGEGYRQYYVCDRCYESEQRRIKAKIH